MVMHATLPRAAPSPVRSDPGLLADLRRYGPFDSTGCFQCGTCSVACSLATGAAPFPRELMRFALLGVREKVVASLSPWICEDCGECAAACPREADPKTSLETLRRFLIGQYDWTGLAARIQRSRAWHLGALVGAGAVVLALIALYHLWYVGMPLGDFARTGMGLEHMFGTITWFTLVVSLLPLVLLASNAARMWRWAARDQAPIAWQHYLAEIPTYLAETATQRRIRRCARPSRWPKHWMVTLGTAVMFVLLVFFLRWFQTDRIYPLYHPQRWIGYAATALLVWGPAEIVVGRLRNREGPEYSRLRELTFPVLLLLTALSGILVHVLRYAGAGLGAHYAYAAHLVISVPMLVIEIPFGKWSHMVYRPLALYLEAVRAGAEAAPAAEGVPEHAR
jgi:ferredoxin